MSRRSVFRNIKQHIPYQPTASATLVAMSQGYDDIHNVTVEMCLRALEKNTALPRIALATEDEETGERTPAGDSLYKQLTRLREENPERWARVPVAVAREAMKEGAGAVARWEATRAAHAKAVLEAGAARGAWEEKLEAWKQAVGAWQEGGRKGTRPKHPGGRPQIARAAQRGDPNTGRLYRSRKTREREGTHRVAAVGGLLVWEVGEDGRAVQERGGGKAATDGSDGGEGAEERAVAESPTTEAQGREAERRERAQSAVEGGLSAVERARRKAQREESAKRAPRSGVLVDVALPGGLVVARGVRLDHGERIVRAEVRERHPRERRERRGEPQHGEDPEGGGVQATGQTGAGGARLRGRADDSARCTPAARPGRRGRRGRPRGGAPAGAHMRGGMVGEGGGGKTPRRERRAGRTLRADAGEGARAPGDHRGGGRRAGEPTAGVEALGAQPTPRAVRGRGHSALPRGRGDADARRGARRTGGRGAGGRGTEEGTRGRGRSTRGRDAGGGGRAVPRGHQVEEPRAQRARHRGGPRNGRRRQAGPEPQARLRRPGTAPRTRAVDVRATRHLARTGQARRVVPPMPEMRAYVEEEPSHTGHVQVQTMRTRGVRGRERGREPCPRRTGRPVEPALQGRGKTRRAARGPRETAHRAGGQGGAFQGGRPPAVASRPAGTAGRWRHGPAR